VFERPEGEVEKKDKKQKESPKRTRHVKQRNSANLKLRSVISVPGDSCSGRGKGKPGGKTDSKKNKRLFGHGREKESQFLWISSSAHPTPETKLQYGKKSGRVALIPLPWRRELSTRSAAVGKKVGKRKEKVKWKGCSGARLNSLTNEH